MGSAQTLALRALLLSLVPLGCARAAAPEARREAPWESPREAPHDASVQDLRVAASELAWLVAHLAQDPSSTHERESDSVVRLSLRGAEGARAAAEVFRVGDASRAPFARRVIERVALRQCRRDRGAALELIAWIQRPGEHPDLDPGHLWRSDAPHWPAEALARLIAWTERGAPCSIAAVSEGGENPPAGDPR